MTRFILLVAGLLGCLFIAEGLLNIADAGNPPPDTPAFAANILSSVGSVKVFSGALLLAIAIGLDELIHLMRKTEGHLARLAPPKPEAPRAKSIWSLRRMEGE